jgi:hypothetical protein
MSRNRLVASTLALLRALAAKAEAAQPRSLTGPASYKVRDGQSEAVMDLRSGRPIKLYSHLFDARISGCRTPGLVNCAPRDAYRAVFT